VWSETEYVDSFINCGCYTYFFGLLSVDLTDFSRSCRIQLIRQGHLESEETDDPCCSAAETSSRPYKKW
jgi:hypothetical protein